MGTIYLTFSTIGYTLPTAQHETLQHSKLFLGVAKNTSPLTSMESWSTKTQISKSQSKTAESRIGSR